MSVFAPSPNDLAGIPIVVSHSLGTVRVQTRLPRSHRQRIRRKWAKDPRNWTTTYKRAIYRMGDTIVCDPVSYGEIMARTEKAP